MLLAITYISVPAGEVDSAGLSSIWIDGMQRNRETDITGGLLFTGTFYFQTIEGDPEKVASLMERIKHDSRHTDVEIISENDLTARLFSEQPLKLIDASQSGHLRERFARERVAGPSVHDVNKAVYRLSRL